MMERRVTAHLELEVSATADMVACDRCCRGHRACRRIARHHRRWGTDSTATPIGAPHGGRLHQLRGVDARTHRDRLSGHGHRNGRAAPIPVAESDWFQYIRPSRYCESDKLGPLARAEFAGLTDVELLAAVSSWVGSNISYVTGSSRPTDGAVNTLLARPACAVTSLI